MIAKTGIPTPRPIARAFLFELVDLLFGTIAPLSEDEVEGVVDDEVVTLAVLKDEEERVDVDIVDCELKRVDEALDDRDDD